MAKFSVGREDDGDEPSCSRRKKPRTATITIAPPPPSPTTTDQQSIEEEEQEEELEEELESESEEEDEQEDSASSETEDDEVEDVIAVETNSGEPIPIEEGSISLTLTDPDVLDCPICLEHLTTPVFQCENGHVACSPCCIKLKNKCPSCSWPIGYNRCRALEKVIESIKISCENSKYGCKEIVSYNKKHEHKLLCVCSPCTCPVPGCTYVGSSTQLSLHFRVKHSDSTKLFSYGELYQVTLQKEPKCVFLQEKTVGTVFAIINLADRLGKLFSVSAIVPASSKEFFYSLMASKEGSVVRLQSYTHNVSNIDLDLVVKRFLMVPNDFVAASGEVKLDLCVWRCNEDATIIR